MPATVALSTSLAPFAAQRASRQQKRSSARLAPRALASDEQQQSNTATRLAGGLLGAAAAALALASPALAREPFLLSTGAKGPLAVEEEQLFRLREAKEQEALKELEGLKLAAEVRCRRHSTQSGILALGTALW